MTRNERGFSLMIVLLCIIVMTVIGLMTVTIGSSDVGAAGAREKRSQALIAAETGFYLMTYSRNAATIATTIEAAAAQEQIDLLEVDTDGDTVPDMQTAYSVTRNGGVFFVEGRLIDEDGRIISRARLGGRLRSFSGKNGYEGQEGLNPRSTGILDQRDEYEREVVQNPL